MKQRTLLITILITLLMALPVSTSFAGAKKHSKAQETQTLSEKKVNINKASVEELSQLPGIGTSKAEAIEQYVEENGKVKNIDELLQVKGIGPKLLDKITPHVTL